MNSPSPPYNSPVSWTQQGHPHSEHFGDVYHTTSGALEQARHVFLRGCNLPARWQSSSSDSPLPVFTVLETGFGLGLNFLTTWLEWRQDPKRCRRLHFVSVEAYPVTASDIEQALHNIPELQELGLKLAHAYPAALSGLHRLVFDEEQMSAPRGQTGQVILTLAIGDARRLLPQLQLQANAIFLDGFSPAKNPELWGPDICAYLAKLAKPNAHIASWCVAGHVRRNLEAAGFCIERVKGLPPKREALAGTFKPQNLSRRTFSTQAGIVSDDHDAIVIGAGFAGASICWALAQRDWQVTLIDKASGPAQGASGLPMGLSLPYISADDALLCQITRCGVQWLRHVITACRLSSKFWSDSPVEQILKDKKAATISENRGTLGGLEEALFEPAITDEGQPCRRFKHGLRLEGSALIRSMLSHTPGLQQQWNTEIARLNRTPEGMWQLFNRQGELCAQSPHVIVAAAMESLSICGLENKGITPTRGQMTLGLPHAQLPADLLDARTGHGHFLLPQRIDAGWSWSMGSTFDRESNHQEISIESHQDNFTKLLELSPRTAQILRPQFEQKQLGAFVEIRCTSADHLPLIGAVPDMVALAQLNAQTLMNEQCPILPGLYILSALGSRGLSTAALGAEFLASMMHQEPWPLTKQQAQAVLPARFELRHKRKTPTKKC